MKKYERNKSNSPIFGETLLANEEELEEIKRFVWAFPVSVFGLLNQKLNKLGFCISIRSEHDRGDAQK